MLQSPAIDAATHAPKTSRAPRSSTRGRRRAAPKKHIPCAAIERIALKSGHTKVGSSAPPTCLPPRAMARVNKSIEALNRGIVNGQESISQADPAGQTWHDLFSAERIAQEHDELWVKRAANNTVAGYAAVKCGSALGSELGLITIGPAHRGQGLAKELIGAILHAHPALQLYVGERNLRAQALYASFTQRGCEVRHVGHKYYGNGEKALGMLIRTSTAAPYTPDLTSRVASAADKGASMPICKRAQA